jgi:Ca2+-binding EF-hand superfamily protein
MFGTVSSVDPSATHKLDTKKLLDGFRNRTTPPAAVLPKSVDLDESVTASLREAFNALVATGRARSLFDAFRAADHGKKGKLSVDDFQDACDAAGMRIKQSEIRKLVDKFDSNGDGFVDLEEFISFLDESGRARSTASVETKAPAAKQSVVSSSSLGARLLSIREAHLAAICGRLQVTTAGCDEAVSMLRAAFTCYDGSRRGVVGTRDVLSVLAAHGVSLTEPDVAAIRSAFRVRSPTVSSTEVDYQRLAMFLVGTASSSSAVLLSVEKESAEREARRRQLEPQEASSTGADPLDAHVLAAFSATSSESLGSWLRSVSCSFKYTSLSSS